ncbi:hypothetical protein ACFFQW_09260 [Umezawaea endophytica]|uniref:Uncharacterized protein n=1 Tax=Umezawaea endophytica TaxID=1654476 RepID=A0A9X3AJ65_9PSEU|nr:hypothetical protein [Umezawaea endophytica]MCS7481335.1 hypothetical protein [Umezawaea endophytica]
MITVLTTLIRDPEVRARYREQWTADLDGAAELGLSRRGLLLGIAVTCLRLRFTTGKAHEMLPIGPLAIALRHLGNRGQVLVATSLSALFLLGGALLLIR